MTTQTIGVLLAAMACGVTLAIAGCDGRSIAPESRPQSIAGGSKSPTVLTECASIFTGIEHCSIGTADLAADAAAGTVVIRDFDADGGNGVSSFFPDAAEWSQSARTDFGTRAGARLHFAAISDEQAVSTLDIVRTGATTLQFTPVFTAGDGGSSRFHVHVFNDGVLRGGAEHINPNTTIPIVGIVGSGDDDRDGGDRPRRKFKSVRSQHRGSGYQWQSTGACEWSQLVMRPGAKFSVRLPNGTVLDGDEVLFTEEVAEGHTAYTDFQRIDVTGNIVSYTIADESSVPVD